MRRMEDDEGPSFYKIMLLSPMVTEQLRIPPDFTKHIEKEAVGRATLKLKGPSGCYWPVKLHKNSNGMFLIDGWRSFFEAHSLKEFEVLVFEYKGKMCFDVKIYGANGLERDNVPENVDSQEVIYLEHDSEDEIETESEEVYVAKHLQEDKRIGKKKKSSRPRKHAISDKRNETKNAEERTSNAKRKPFRPTKHPLADSLSLVTGVRAESCTINEKFSSAFPFFELHMDPNRLKRRECSIPVKFARIYLLNGEAKNDIVLRNKKGNSWEVNVTRYDNSSVFGAGWGWFARDNKLKPGDHCIFELVKKTEMQVHIFRNHLKI